MHVCLACRALLAQQPQIAQIIRVVCHYATLNLMPPSPLTISLQRVRSGAAAAPAVMALATATVLPSSSTLQPTVISLTAFCAA